MLIPPGFTQQSVMTTLGRMAYYTTARSPAPVFPNPDTSETAPAPAGLVFLHGFGGGSSAYEWSQVYPAFASRFQVLAPDLLGWGRSDHPPRNYTAEDYITTITQFLEQTCSNPVPVVASSLTAAMAVRVAIARPDLFKSLILVAPTGLMDFGSNTMTVINNLAKTPFLDRLLYQFAIATPDGIRSFLEQRQFTRPERVWPELVEAYLTSAQQPGAEYAALSFVRGDLSFDLAAFMPQLQTPTAIIWGQQAQFTSAETGKRLAELNPRAVHAFQVLEGVGLTPHLEQPAVTIALIQRYVSELATLR